MKLIVVVEMVLAKKINIFGEEFVVLPDFLRHMLDSLIFPYFLRQMLNGLVLKIVFLF